MLLLIKPQTIWDIFTSIIFVIINRDQAKQFIIAFLNK